MISNRHREGDPMGWHIPVELIHRYQRGGLSAADAMAVEAHLATCASCRAGVPAEDGWVEQSWAGVLEVVGRPRRHVIEIVLHRLGMPEHRARLLAATPALRWSWLLSTAAVLAFAVGTAYAVNPSDISVLAVFLAVAPIVPLAAVAVAFGAYVDPLHEITATTPMAGPGLLLWRASTVLVISLGMVGVAAVCLPAGGALAAAWLLPALALCLGSLALGTAVPVRVAAGVLGGGWLAAVVAAADSLVGQQRVFGPAAQLTYLTAALVAALVLTVRLRHLKPGEPR